jgi:hypothetical protein
VFDFHSLDDPVGARLHGEGGQGRDHHNRDALSLDLFADRCAATIAGASGGDQEDTIRVMRSEAPTHLDPVARAIRQPLIITYR